MLRTIGAIVLFAFLMAVSILIVMFFALAMTVSVLIGFTYVELITWYRQLKLRNT